LSGLGGYVSRCQQAAPGAGQLNTHNASAFYEHLPAAEAFALAERFEFIYTPKSASWLNMIECEFAVLTRLCLSRRIPTIELLRSETLTLLDERSSKQVKIHWQFSVQAARTKLNNHYTRVHPDNEKYKETYFTDYLVLRQFLQARNVQ
jgi:hypothetical protein